MKVEYLAAFNLLIAVVTVKTAVAPDKVTARLIGPLILAFVIVNSIALGAGLAEA